MKILAMMLSFCEHMDPHTTRMVLELPTFSLGHLMSNQAWLLCSCYGVRGLYGAFSMMDSIS